MSTRRFVAVGAGVTALLVVAGLASHGRPLSSGGGAGPTATFFDYVATTLAIFFVIMLGIVVWALFSDKTKGTPVRRSNWHLLSYFGTLAGAAVIASLILHSGFEQRLRKAADAFAKKNQGGQAQAGQPVGKNVRNARIRWDEVAIVVVLIGGTAVVLLARRNTKRAPRPWRLGRRGEAVSFAVDESLDDLRNDPDLRRAIVAAYARMERALETIGLGRRPSEAPFEYIARALTSLETSAKAAERLTTLFEWAKFSHHEP
ncbi:MAG: DUF4129 domain-containing protein, partial [Actinomycetota bacterium]